MRQQGSLEEEVARVEGKDPGHKSTLRRHGRHKPRGQKPDPPIRFCGSCQQDVRVTDNWTCPTEGCTCRGEQTDLLYSTTRKPCDKCGRVITWMYIGNDLKPLNCQCKETPAERQEREQREEAERERELEEKRHIRNAEKAITCYEDMNGECELPRDATDVCYACRRWTGHYLALIRAKKREQG